MLNFEDIYIKMWKILFLIVFISRTLVNCQLCSSHESVVISSGVRHLNGSLEHDGILYNSDEWFELEEDGVKELYGCPCLKRKCVWKCCGNGQAYFGKNCTDTNIADVNPFNPPLYKGEDPVNAKATDLFYYMYGSPCVESYFMNSDSPWEQFFLQENGSLHEFANGIHQYHEPPTYCLEQMVNENDTTSSSLMALICYPERDSPWLTAAYGIGVLLSVPFLLATIIVYAFIPELRNLHGLCLMAYCAGLIVAYVFLAYLLLAAVTLDVDYMGCYAIAFMTYYAFQTSFFWLNVMCFDIWRTFRGHRGHSNSKRSDRRRFMMYGAYAWGVPLALTGVVTGMQLATNLPENIVTPGLGVSKCWFYEWKGELVYFYSPIFVLVITNVIFFTVTSYRIQAISQETAILKGAESARSDKVKRDKQRYVLYLKLFVVMGVNWILELISFFIGGSNWYWIVMDISNMFVGPFVFFIFVWKNKVRNLLRKRIRSFRGIQTATETIRSSTAPTEDTRISSDETAIRLKDMS